MASPRGDILVALFHMYPNETAFILPFIKTINCVSVATNLLLGLPLHVYVAWVIVTKDRNGIASELFALNLATSEIIFCLGSIAYLFPYASAWECVYFFTTFLFTSRPCFQTCISMERYLAVLHPVLFLRYKPLRYKLMDAALCWLLILGCSVMTSFYGLIHTVYVLLVANSVLFLVMSFCCLSILRALIQPGPGQGTRANHAKMKAFKIILILVLSLLFNFTIAITGVIILFSQVSFEVSVINYNIAVFIMTLTGFTQPLVYLHTTGRLACKPASSNTASK